MMDATPSTPPPPPRDDNNNAAFNDPLALPSPEVLAEIARKQDARAAEIQAARLARRQSKKGESASVTEEQNRSDAAVMIQRNYRGHRTRRAMEGRSLDPSVRWIEALKDGELRASIEEHLKDFADPYFFFVTAKYNNVTAPRARATSSLTPTSPVRERWKRAVAIAHRAGSDDFSESEIEGDTEEEKAAAREAKAKERQRREKYAKTMGLDYFLEMVDNKHRYGSNLRRYHKEWKQSQTHENFFYWLDHGEGKDLDLPDRPRTRLDTELVRYLSREERQKYLVHIDDMGRFVFSKNGVPVTTSSATTTQHLPGAKSPQE
jgi:hypothetical protein